MFTEKTIPEQKLAKIKRILIIQYKPFGDVLLNTAYLPALRKKFPEAAIDFLVQRPYKTILEDNPNLDDIIVMEKKKRNTFAYYWERVRTIIRVRKLKYDMIIDQMRGTGSAQITLFSGADYQLGWKLKRWNWVYNYQRKRTNDRYYALMKFHVLEPLGIKEEDKDLFYAIKTASQQKIDTWLQDMKIKAKQFVVFSPGTPVLAKKWSLDFFVKLGDMIQENSGLRIVLLWGPGEKDDCEYIAKKMRENPFIAPPTSFNEAAALLKRAYIYISQDGGINHVSIAVKTPSIAIFGPHSNPKKWQAWHRKEHPYLRNYDCNDRKDRTLGITPQMVMNTFQELSSYLNSKENQ